MEQVRQIIYFKEYFNDFYEDQSEKVKDKIDQVLFVVTVAERIPKKFFEHMEGTDGLYEIRVEFKSDIFRIFSCFDEGRLIILLNGFQKKSQKTPKNEIEKALKIMNEYFEWKNTEKNESKKNKK